MRGENYLHYVPNGDHGLDADANDSIVAFYSLILSTKKPPELPVDRGGGRDVAGDDAGAARRKFDSGRPTTRKLGIFGWRPSVADPVRS